MFASLVVVYLTIHQGGALLFRHGDLEFTFDSGAAVSRATTPCVGFAAFYSDVEHEVTEVHSGHRVTLTYNLYLEDSPKGDIVSFAGAYESALKAAFEKLLADPSYFEDGGNIGFGLRHQYPVQIERRLGGLQHLQTSLKSSDAILMKVCKELSLKAQLRLLYHVDDGGVVLCNKLIRKDEKLEGDLLHELCRRGAEYVEAPEGWVSDDDDDLDVINIDWATDIKPVDVKEVETVFIAYGNEPSLGFAYSTMCLIVEVDTAKVRLAGAAPT